MQINEINSSLLREKFVIHDPALSENERKKKAVTALSNRMEISLASEKGTMQESFVVRAQNMHSCVRMCARIIHAYTQAGQLMGRAKPFDWDEAWDAIVNDYEFSYNRQRWIAVYNKGKPVYSKGEVHVLLDLIEKCAAQKPNEYDQAIIMAEDLFNKNGKTFKIGYDGNVALVVQGQKEQARCAVILRTPGQTKTFNFIATRKPGIDFNLPLCLSVAAAFLEGIQLAFMVGMNGVKIQMGIIERGSAEEKQTREGYKRLGRLAGEIENLENACEVRYRPEKPDFFKTVKEAEKLAAKTITPPEGSGFIR